MPKGQSPRSNLLARYGAVEKRLANMRKAIPETATGATGVVGRALQAYTNTMSGIGEKLVTSQPNYVSLRRLLSKIENGLDTNAAKLSKAKGRG